MADARSFSGERVFADLAGDRFALHVVAGVENNGFPFNRFKLHTASYDFNCAIDPHYRYKINFTSLILQGFAYKVSGIRKQITEGRRRKIESDNAQRLQACIPDT